MHAVSRCATSSTHPFLALSVAGVGFAVLLVLVMAGIFVGTINQVTTYIDHSRNAVWVTNPGVADVPRRVVAADR